MSGKLSEQFRKNAKEQSAAVDVLRDKDPEMLKAETVAFVAAGISTAHMLNALADLLTWIEEGSSVDATLSRRQKIMRENNAIRTAAAAGRWEEFGKLIEKGIRFTTPPVYSKIQVAINLNFLRQDTAR